MLDVILREILHSALKPEKSLILWRYANSKGKKLNGFLNRATLMNTEWAENNFFENLWFEVIVQPFEVTLVDIFFQFLAPFFRSMCFGYVIFPPSCLILELGMFFKSLTWIQCCSTCIYQIENILMKKKIKFSYMLFNIFRNCKELAGENTL